MRLTVKHGHVLPPLPKETAATYTHLFKCMLRIRQRVGLNLSNAATTSAGWAPLYWMLPRFARVFITIRGPQAHWDSVESNPPFPFPPRGKPGRGKVPPTPRHVPRQLTTLARPMLRLPPQEGLSPPLRHPPTSLSRCPQARTIAPGKKLRVAATSALTFMTFS